MNFKSNKSILEVIQLVLEVKQSILDEILFNFVDILEDSGILYVTY